MIGVTSGDVPDQAGRPRRSRPVPEGTGRDRTGRPGEASGAPSGSRQSPANHLGAVFAALADPSRRTIVERLAAAGRATPTELAGELPMTRQAVAKHLAALEHAGLVQSRREGRHTVYRPDPAPLRDATAWMSRMGAEWDARLEALARHVGERRPP